MGNYSDDDLEAEENEFGTLDEESPPPEGGSHYLQPSMTNMAGSPMRMPAAGMGAGGVNVNGTMGPPMGIAVSQQI